jgi:hypothetical protein
MIRMFIAVIRFNKLFYTGFIFYLSTGISFSQITAVGQSFTGEVSYPVSTFRDPVFTYNAVCGSTDEKTGQLIAEAPGSEQGCDFQWSRYNPLSNSYDFILQTDLSQVQSTLTDAVEGGYQVHITKAAVLDTFFRAWVFTHNLAVTTLKTADGKIPSNKYTCQYLDLNGSFATDSFRYYDPVSGTMAILPNVFSVNWSLENIEEYKEKAFSKLSLRTYDPPVFNTLYTLHISDQLGYSCQDTVRYESIQTRAEFTYQFLDKFGENEGEYRPMQATGESSPATFRFINKSINGDEYTWILSDTVFSYNQKDSTIVYASDTARKPSYTYYVPFEYTATLISWSNENCVDTFRNDVPILIMPSAMVSPNVFFPRDASASNIFTPNADGVNDVFYIYPEDDNTDDKSTIYASIKSFRITIFSRWGKKVYTYEGAIDNWEGWNGGINNNLDRPAVDGVYYYIIEATGYDRIEYKGTTSPGAADNYTGFLYLYRQQQ